MIPEEMPESIKEEIRTDTGDCKQGVAYVKDNGKWREVQSRDYAEG